METLADKRKTRNAQCVRRDRPTWWSPEEVLSRLQSGQHVGAICAQASEEVEGKLSPSYLRAEISKWANSASWGEQITKALKILYRDPKAGLLVSSDWHDEFFLAMDAADGNAQEAAQLCGIGYGVVLSVLDRRNKCYDAAFAERFRVAEAERVGRVREKFFQSAEDGTNAKAQESILQTHLPGLHAPKSQIEVSGEVAHSHAHTHGIKPELVRQVVEASGARMRGRAGAEITEHGALPPADIEREGRVIDVTPQRDRVEERA
jgi:hypothetical protein